MESFALYALALGVSAVYLVPLIANVIKGMLPSTLAANFNVPTATPATTTAGLWSVVFWGVLLWTAIYIVSMIKPVGRAIRREA